MLGARVLVLADRRTADVGGGGVVWLDLEPTRIAK